MPNRPQPIALPFGDRQAEGAFPGQAHPIGLVAHPAHQRARPAQALDRPLPPPPRPPAPHPSLPLPSSHTCFINGQSYTNPF